VLKDVSGTLALAEQVPALESLEANGGDGASSTSPNGDGGARTDKVSAGTDKTTVTNSVARTVAEQGTGLDTGLDTELDTALTESGLTGTVLGNELSDTTLAGELAEELANTVDRPGEVRASLRQVVAAA
jgi:hypothetical protein